MPAVCGYRWTDGLNTSAHGTHRCGDEPHHTGMHDCRDMVRQPDGTYGTCGAIRA